MSDEGKQVIGRIKARKSRTPAKFAPGRKHRLELGKEAASDLISGTIAKNRRIQRNQSTDSNN